MLTVTAKATILATMSSRQMCSCQMQVLIVEASDRHWCNWFWFVLTLLLLFLQNLLGAATNLSKVTIWSNNNEWVSVWLAVSMLQCCIFSHICVCSLLLDLRRNRITEPNNKNELAQAFHSFLAIFCKTFDYFSNHSLSIFGESCK